MPLRDVLPILLIIEIAACFDSFRYPFRVSGPECGCSRGNFGSFTIDCDTFPSGMTLRDCVKLFHKTNLTEKNIEFLSVVNLPADVWIPTRDFEDANIRVLHISFSNSKISVWRNEEGSPALVGLENTLEELELIMSLNIPRLYYDYLDEKTPILLGHLRKLKRVSFVSNDINTFANGWFDKGQSSLQYLKLKSCKTRDFGDRAFADLSNLKEIDLSENDFESLSRSMFPNPANHLEKMNLEYNKLKCFSDDFFTNMPALTEVNLLHNFISNLKQDIWRPVWSQLTKLMLGHNHLNCDNHHIRWMFKVKPPKYLKGYCKEPAQMVDVTLEELIARHRSKY